MGRKMHSTHYHSLRGQAKRPLQVLDHHAIYLMIAGTYTPVSLVALGGAAVAGVKPPIVQPGSRARAAIRSRAHQAGSPTGGVSGGSPPMFGHLLACHQGEVHTGTCS
jgi:hypothetical protein